MHDRNSLLAFFRVNGISADVPKDTITESLRNIGWSESEINNAHQVLGGADAHPTVSTADVATAYDLGLSYSSTQVSSLLGIHVQIDPSVVRSNEEHQAARGNHIYAFLGTCAIVILSLAIAVGAGTAAAYVFEVGPFLGK